VNDLIRQGVGVLLAAARFKGVDLESQELIMFCDQRVKIELRRRGKIAYYDCGLE